MTDKELLELAAKAAGIEGEAGEHYVVAPRKYDTLGFEKRMGIETPKGLWNPLLHDVDAFRLAVDLKIPVWFASWPSEKKYVACQKIWHVNDSMYYDDGIALDDDPHAATRRAIVRAAAEIGRETK